MTPAWFVAAGCLVHLSCYAQGEATSKSIATAARIKPDKPRPDFPLFLHGTGPWAKKIRVKLHYFGKWKDPDAAHDLYVRQRDELYAGRKPRGCDADGSIVRNLLNRFLTAKQHLVDTGELSSRSFRDYRDTCEQVKEAFGLSGLVAVTSHKFLYQGL